MPQDNQDKLEQALIERASTPARGTAYEAPRIRGKMYPTEQDIYHPKDTKEGMIEWLVKSIGDRTGRLLPQDFPFLEQYLHPDKDILPKTTLRPTKATPQQMEYREIPSDWYDRVVTQTDPKTDKPVWRLRKKQRFGYSDAAGGLGHYTSSETPEYKSIYDIWDFNSPFDDTYADVPVVNDAVAAIMSKLGKPFVIYNRIPNNSPKIEDPAAEWLREQSKKP